MRYGRRDDVMRFADEVAQRHNLDVAWVRAALERARFTPAVARLIMPAASGTAKNWAAYRSRFVEPIRIRAGLAFWRNHQRWLDAAEARFGVPPEVVVGIIGVESIFGQHTGTFRVIDALATLAFDFPTGRKDRTPFFRDELEAFLLMCHQGGQEPLAVKGSYAGAIGMPQFLPSSVNKYAVDFDGDGAIDLKDSPADVIGSVANYMAQFGWQRGMPTRFDVTPPSSTTERALLLVPDIVPSFSAQEMLQRGATLGSAGQTFDGKLALVELQNGDAAPSFVAGTPNFYAITRYNWSSYYALAVIELGEAIAQERARAAR
ncbi:MAG: lytic transglycosylase [Methylibium sp. NZG]|nr:MAG: lytic transglycosylase [Methylibium sp. NZG]